MKRYTKVTGLILGIVALGAFLALNCPSNITNTTNTSGSTGNTSNTPMMTSITCNPASSTTCNPVWVFDGSEHFNFTVNTDIAMTTLTVTIKDLGGPADCSLPGIVNPANTTATLTINLNCIPVGSIYPWVKVCNGTNCNTFEYNAGFPAVYYQVGVGATTVPITLY